MNRTQDPMFRKIGSYPVNDGAQVSVDLPRDLDYSAIIIRLDGVPTTTGPYTGKTAAPFQLMQNVSLVANGSKQLFNGGGLMAYQKNILANEVKAPAFTFGTASLTAFFAELWIDQAIIDGIVPKDGQFPSGNLSSFKLSLSMDLLNNVISGSTGTFTGTVTVYAVCVREYPDAKGGRFVPKCVQYWNELSIPATTTQTDSQVTLVTNTLQRQIVLAAFDAGVNVDAINNVRIERSGVILANLDRLALKALMRRSHNALAVGASEFVYAIDPARYMGQPTAKMSDGYDMRSDGVAEQLYLYISFTGAANRSIKMCQNHYQNYSNFLRG